MVNVLSPFTSAIEFIIKNSCEIAEFTKTLIRYEDYILISNIPKTLVINIILKKWIFLSAYADIAYKLFAGIIFFI